MKSLFTTIIVSLLSFATFADDHKPVSYGMEGYQCNFKEGKDLDDALNFTAKSLNPYADKNWSVPYSGFYLTPFLRSEEIDFDIAWVGFTNSHKDMGIVQDSWFSEEAASTFKKWEAISDCDSQGYYMAIEARAPTVPFEEGGMTIWAIRSCSFEEGKSVDDLAASDEVWNTYNDEIGFTGGVWRWWPGPGTPNTFEGDFLLNISYNSWEEYGQSLDDRFWGKTPQTGTLSCDTPRVYTAINARNRPFGNE